MDSKIVGDGDTILGVGPAFFLRTEIDSIGPFMWIRNTDANHGNVFVDSTFVAVERPLPWAATSSPAVARPASMAVLARLPTNHGINYPYAEAVLIHCTLKGLPDVGWGTIEGDLSHLHFWEYDSVDGEGRPVNTAARHAASKQMKEPEDAAKIAKYRDPAFVLGGWTPVVE